MNGTITTEPIGSGTTEIVRRDGRELGDVVAPFRASGAYLAQPQGARHGTYRFATRDDAVAALVSYADRGWWTGEIG